MSLVYSNQTDSWRMQCNGCGTYACALGHKQQDYVVKRSRAQGWKGTFCPTCRAKLNGHLLIRGPQGYLILRSKDRNYRYDWTLRREDATRFVESEFAKQLARILGHEVITVPPVKESGPRSHPLRANETQGQDAGAPKPPSKIQRGFF